MPHPATRSHRRHQPRTLAYAALEDLNHDGTDTAADDALLDESYTDNLGLSGRGRLTAAKLSNRKGYAGYEHDESLTMYHVRHRVYRPELGRWMTRDPLGYVDGMGLYEYVGGMPTARIDPMGLDGQPILGSCETYLDESSTGRSDMGSAESDQEHLTSFYPIGAFGRTYLSLGNSLRWMYEATDSWFFWEVDSNAYVYEDYATWTSPPRRAVRRHPRGGVTLQNEVNVTCISRGAGRPGTTILNGPIPGIRSKASRAMTYSATSTLHYSIHSVAETEWDKWGMHDDSGCMNIEVWVEGRSVAKLKYNYNISPIPGFEVGPSSDVVEARTERIYLGRWTWCCKCTS